MLPTASYLVYPGVEGHPWAEFYYVCSCHEHATDLSQRETDGRDPDRPFSNVGSALARINAPGGRGLPYHAIVLVGPGHTEIVDARRPWRFGRDGIIVYGFGRDQLTPKVQVYAPFEVRGRCCSLRNVVLHRDAELRYEDFLAPFQPKHFGFRIDGTAMWNTGSTPEIAPESLSRGEDALRAMLAAKARDDAAREGAEIEARRRKAEEARSAAETLETEADEIEQRLDADGKAPGDPPAG